MTFLLFSFVSSLLLQIYWDIIHILYALTILNITFSSSLATYALVLFLFWPVGCALSFYVQLDSMENKDDSPNVLSGRMLLGSKQEMNPCFKRRAGTYLKPY